jgi:Flp pilus assembly protein TadB
MAVTAVLTSAAISADQAYHQKERERKAMNEQERLQDAAQKQAAVMAGREMEEARNLKNKQNRKPFVQDAEQMTSKSGTMLAGGGATGNQLKTSSMLGGY